MKASELPREWILFETISGSNAYGLNTPESDIDISGVFQSPLRDLLSLKRDVDRAADEKSDIEYHELEKFFIELIKCGPNVIEMLYMPEDCVRIMTPQMQMIIDNRDLFISQKCYHSFAGYAVGQIKRAKGQNKWINNPQPEEHPNKWDFCWIIEPDALLGSVPKYRKLGFLESFDFGKKCVFPCRARKMNPEMGFVKCTHYHASKMEHSENMYRVYDYTDQAGNGIFRGASQQLVLESIPKEDELSRFAGLLIYNEPAYAAAKRDWKNYWEWKKNRNEARYRTQESGEIDYDAKNMLHCFRLLWSGMNILRHGEPIVRFDSDKKDELMKIRRGEYTHEELMVRVDKEMELLAALNEKTQIPHTADREKIDELYMNIRTFGE